MKKTNPTLLLAIPILALAVSAYLFISSYHDSDSRAQYEKYLLSESKKVSSVTENLGDVPEPGQPEMAVIQDYFETMDPAEKRVPLDGLKKAYKSTILEASKKVSAAPLEWDIVNSVMGGRARVIEYDPNVPGSDKVWAGAVTGGLWYINDISGGLSSWVAVDDFWPTLSISSIAFDPLDPLIMYVGTGEAFTATEIYRESSGVGMGIFKSTDGGVTWDLIPSTEDFKYVTDIEVRIENGISVIYAGVVSGDYQGQNHISLPSDGLYRSANGGESWLQVLPNIAGSDKPYAVADIEVASNGRIFVGTKRNLDDDGGATILYSDSGIIGSWTIFDDYVAVIQSDPDYYVPGRVMLASAPSNPDVVYALFGAGYISSSNGFTYTRGRHIARTDNGGATWNYRPYPTGGDYFWATLAWHALAAEVDPNDPDHVYIGGLDVYKSENGAQSWTQVSDWRGMYNGGGDDYVHADIHDIDFKPNSSDELIISTDGGVFYTDNAGSFSPDFQEKNIYFGTLQFYSCDIYPIPGVDKYVGGLQDNGTLYYTGQALSIFDMIGGGDGAYCFIDENEPQLMLISVYYNQYTLFLNENWFDGLGDWSSGIFINPSDYDYNENALYANACEFSGYRANQILRIDGLPYNGDGDFVFLNTNTDVWFSSVTYSPWSPEGTANLFLGTLSGRLYKVEGAQANNPQVTEITGDDFPIANISCVAVGSSEDTLLVTFSNYGVSSVWQSYDGGATWMEKEGNLPDMPIRWALYHPMGAKHAMLATETGIWTTDQLDQSTTEWVPDNNGLANVRVDMLSLRQADYTVLAATHGRGLATTTWDITIGVDEPESLEALVYPNPSTGVVHFRLDSGQSFEQINIYDLSGKALQSFNIGQSGNEIRLDLEMLPTGQYVVEAVSGGKKWRSKLVLVE
jgi:hypothetical protein